MLGWVVVGLGFWQNGDDQKNEDDLELRTSSKMKVTQKMSTTSTVLPEKLLMAFHIDRHNKTDSKPEILSGVSQTCLRRISCTSSISQPYLMYISSIPWEYLYHISSISQTCLKHISGNTEVYPKQIFIIYQVYLK